MKVTPARTERRLASVARLESRLVPLEEGAVAAAQRPSLPAATQPAPEHHGARGARAQQLLRTQDEAGCPNPASAL
jgi:hypothetical protein